MCKMTLIASFICTVPTWCVYISPKQNHKFQHKPIITEICKIKIIDQTSNHDLLKHVNKMLGRL